jgi:hypothetical protein
MNYQELLKNTETLDNGCIVWTKSRSKGGYGQKAVNGKKQYTHRLSAEIHYGPGASGQEVMHLCDNPPCLNPKHLKWGTRKQNVADMLAKGRHRTNPKKGEDHSQSKLAKEDVLEIRILAGRGFVLTDLAKMYGITAAEAHLIVQRKRWREVKEIGEFFTS